MEGSRRTPFDIDRPRGGEPVRQARTRRRDKRSEKIDAVLAATDAALTARRRIVSASEPRDECLRRHRRGTRFGTQKWRRTSSVSAKTVALPVVARGNELVWVEVFDPIPGALASWCYERD